jgi:hypothetical protein
MTEPIRLHPLDPDGLPIHQWDFRPGEPVPRCSICGIGEAEYAVMQGQAQPTLGPHLFVGADATRCDLCLMPRADQSQHTDWNYQPPVADLEDCHPFTGTGPTCGRCGLLPQHIIHALHEPETGELSWQERQVIALHEIAGALHRIEDHVRKMAANYDG